LTVAHSAQPDVFLSYASSDRAIAEAIRTHLEAAGISCWIDHRDIAAGSASWTESIIEALNSCRVLVVVVSAAANASPQVRREVERAVDKRLTIVPLRVEDVLPAGALEFLLASVQWLDAAHAPLQTRLDELIDVVRNALMPAGDVKVRAEREAVVQRLGHVLDAGAERWNDLPYRSFVGDLLGIGTPPPLTEIYVRQPFRRERIGVFLTLAGERVHAGDMTLKEALGDSRHVLLQGDAGSGKTSMLRELALDVIREWRTGRGPTVVPIYVAANTIVAETTEPGSLATRLVRQLRRDLSLDLPERLLTAPLPESVSWLVLVDGLDEVVVAQHRESLLREIEGESRRRTSSLRFVVASRPVADLQYHLGPERFARYILRPFDRRQAEALVQKWVSWAERPSRLASRLLAQLDRPGLAHVVQSPVLLTMALLTCLHDSRKAVPENRVALYERFIGCMLGSPTAKDRTAWRNVRDAWNTAIFHRGEEAAANLLRERRALLERLAFFQQEHGFEAKPTIQHAWEIAREQRWIGKALDNRNDREWILEEGIPFLLTQTGLVRRQGDLLLFVHNTVREFLAACRWASNRPASAAGAALYDLWSDPRWREVASMCTALWSGQPRWQPLLAGRLADTLNVSRRGANFVGTVLADGVQLRDEDRTRLEGALVDTLAKWNPCGELFHEFRSPDPVPTLRGLMASDFCRTRLLVRMTTEGTRCPRALGRLLDMAYEFWGTAEIQTLAERGAELWVRIDAAKHLARFGRPEQARDLLRTFASDSSAPVFERCLAMQALGDLGIDAMRLKSVGDAAGDAALQFVAGLAGHESSREVGPLVDAVRLATERSRDIDSDVRDRWYPVLARRLWLAGRTDQAVEFAIDHTTEFDSIAQDLLQIPGVQPAFSDKLRRLAADDARSVPVRLACLDRLVIDGTADGLAEVAGQLVELTRDGSETERLRAATLAASLDRSDFLRAIAENASQSLWIRVKAMVWLARRYPSENWVSRLRMMSQQRDAPEGQRIEVAVALIGLGREDEGIQDLFSAVTDGGQTRRICRALFDLERPQLLERVVVEGAPTMEEFEYCARGLRELGALVTLQRIATNRRVPAPARAYCRKLAGDPPRPSRSTPRRRAGRRPSR
jgi:hypothetical protein